MKLLLITNYRLQITFNFHVHHQIVLQVAENVAQNESFVLSKVPQRPNFSHLTGANISLRFTTWLTHGSLLVLLSNAWWRHQMETFSALLALCAGNSPVPVNSLHKGQWRGALMFPLICAWIHDWVNNREAGDLRRYRGHYDVNVMGHQ